MTPAEVHRCGRASRDERAWRYAEVACGRCGAVVQVAKFSLQHTSVQWTAEAVLRCAEFSAHVADGGSSALVATCASLRASIDAAVSDGRVEVLPP
ncbi:MAG TPA: hypothetical protein VF162_10125 [Streptosporangiaceae bacterium]